MTPGTQASYWRAVEALREAETLANLAGAVSGPADEPPKQDSDQDSFIEDWTGRAKQALSKAAQWATAPERFLRERGKRIAKRISDGAHELMRRVNKANTRIWTPLQTVTDTAEKIQLAWGLGTIFATALVAYAAYRIFVKKS